MPKGPRVHEIFSNNALDNSAAFKYEEQESIQQIQLKKKTTPAPMVPMKKFGAHKPKILSAENTDALIENEAGLSLDKALLKRKSTPAPGVPDEPPRVTLTKPKPFVIGDKDVPMVLSTLEDGELENGNGEVNNGFVVGHGEHNARDLNGNLEDKIDDLHIYNSVIHDEDRAVSMDSLQNSDTSTLISSVQNTREHLAYENPALEHDISSLSESIEATPSPLSPPTAQDVSFFLVQDNSPNSLTSDTNDELDGVFIPPPDYDEDEQTLDFAEEDTDNSDGSPSSPTSGAERKTRQARRNKPLTHVYEGEDLSHYLSDDEAATEAQQVEMRNHKSKKGSSNKSSKTVPRPPRLSDKHSMFKPPPPSKRKGSAKGKPQGFNSVRSFSYADSKFGTMSKAKAAAMPLNSSFSEFGDDSEMFLQAHSSYESFLRSRHGDAVMPPDSSDSGVDMDDRPQLKQKEDPLWKKLTLRFKNKSNKEYSLQNQ